MNISPADPAAHEGLVPLRRHDPVVPAHALEVHEHVVPLAPRSAVVVALAVAVAAAVVGVALGAGGGGALGAGLPEEKVQ